VIYEKVRTSFIKR